MIPSFNLGNMFRNTQQVAPAPTQQAAPPSQQNPSGAPNSTLNAPAAKSGKIAQEPPKTPEPSPQQSTEQNSPLDSFKDIWNTPDAARGDQNADPFASPLFQTDPAKIREAAGQIDFLSQVPQELMQKAMSGSDPQAFMSVINAVAQNSLSMALQLSTATTEQAGQKLGQRFNGALPSKFKNLQIESQQSTNPVLQHPAVKPMLGMVRQQIQMQNPDATPDQIQKMAEDYMVQFAGAMVPGGGQGGGNQASSQEQTGQDWSAWAFGNG